MATLTPERQKYEAVRRNQANLRQVNALMLKESTTVLGQAEGLDQQNLGGFLRGVVPGLIDRYGKINAVVAMQYYDEQRLAALARQESRTRAQRSAAARLRGQVYKAKMPEFNAPQVAEPIIGYGMSKFMSEGFAPMREAVTNSLTRAVASYNRDTLLYNASLDDAVITVQRVAEPNACAFCALMAFSSTRSAAGKPLDVRTTSYAVDFHDHCNCTIETIYEGDEPIRPDYYDKFEQEYLDASGGSAKQVLSKMRENTGRA